MKIRDKTPSAILNFPPPPLLESRVLRVISKLRRGMGGLKSPSSLRWRSVSLCIRTGSLHPHIVWVVLLGSLAELLSHPLCPFPKKLEDTGETHRFSIARICDVLSVWDFQSRF